MEIKIINHNENETFIFEGYDIVYHFYSFKNQNEFLEYWGKISETDNDIRAIGIPTEYWDDMKKCDIGTIIELFFYDNKDERKLIIVRRSKIYITNKGQTIDIIDI